MKHFIVEFTIAYKIPAETEEEAMEKWFNEDPGMHEHWHEEAGFWSELTASYADDSESEDIDG